jgi:dihydrofolate synthase / folylpolyglutamate synthase
MTRYQQALDLVWGLVNFETKPPENREPYTLDRMRTLAERLGNPQRRLRTIHVAGTKGKGSTAAMIERALRAAGYRTGLYSSPHLHDPRERLRIDGNPVSREDFISLVERLRPHIDALPDVTTFEALTAMAFLWFVESEVDLVVLEVGLGGRLDATNLVTPLLSVITPLALEHTAVLGNTIEEIAAEKGGIIKPGVPVVTAVQSPAARAVLERIATERAAPLVVAGEQLRAERTRVTLEGQQFSVAWLEGGGSGYEALHLSMLGRHQVENSLVAIAALHELREQGVPWEEAAIREGLAAVEWPARVEVLQRKPLVVADGAHTPESATALVSALREACPGGWARGTLVIGISSDKNISGILPALRPLADRVILTRSRHPRSADPQLMASDPSLAEVEARVARRRLPARGRRIWWWQPGRSSLPRRREQPCSELIFSGAGHAAV